MPRQFLDYMNYVTRLAFKEEPDFTMLKQLIIDAAAEESIDLFDNVFDWNIKLVMKQRIRSQPGPAAPF